MINEVEPNTEDECANDTRLEAGRITLPSSITTKLNDYKATLRAEIKAINDMFEAIRTPTSSDHAKRTSLANLVKNFEEKDEKFILGIWTEFGLEHDDDIVSEAVDDYERFKEEEGINTSLMEARYSIYDIPSSISNLSLESNTVMYRHDTHLSPRGDTQTPSHLVSNHHTIRENAITNPGIQITKFHGDPLKYDEFINSFEANFHSNTLISPLLKFIYFKAYLSGDPLTFVNLLPPHNDSYDKAIQLLNSIYGSQLAKDYARDKLLLAEPTSGSPEDLLAYLCNMRMILSDEPDMQFVFTRNAILKHFPRKYLTPIFLEEARNDKRFSLDEVMEKIDNNLTVEISTQNIQHFDEDSDESNASVRASCPCLQPHTYLFQDTFNRSNQRKPRNTYTDNQTSPSCFFCQEDHDNNSCNIYPTPHSKRAVMMLKKKRACWICFKEDHRSRSCREPRCTRCGDDHNVMLCLYNYKKTNVKMQPVVLHSPRNPLMFNNFTHRHHAHPTNGRRTADNLRTNTNTFTSMDKQDPSRLMKVSL
ncbi:unnamed protein product [Auanema sp. JU1783]|nr:unnamed protein product [Auanema sp. JU1783]